MSISGIYIALTAFLTLYLAYRVTGFRRSQNTGIGDNDDKAFQVAIRAHGNLIEYAPISLLLLLAAELGGASAVFLHLSGLVFVASRVSHAWGFIQAQGGYSPFRFVGTLANWIIMIVLAIHLLWAAL